ncbi:HET-domain-containing protein [Hypoxylon trugodes]|uniref:HET-domain-containing protein n=1 Tax=Hypoxylon trugodes TaxID=326681 RepID=UPI00219033F6|nr:HET-domain-containing protein [Hypoxylon trugodes]KAI1384336.1 HET-domain-containing protein [Hypoxylon trugodes]
MSKIFQSWTDLPQDSGCIRNLNQMRNWLRECEEGDDRCKIGRTMDYLPTRVLDVSRQEDKVFVTEGERCEKGPYITLSHCWGESHPIQTTTMTLPVFRTQGIPLSSLPKTFREAVFVTRYLGCPYLWIDSLCIIQGDREDWAMEAPRMADVYSNSHVTIAATASATGSGGLFYQNNETQVKYTVRRKRKDGTPIEIYVRPALNHSVYDLGPIDPPNPLYPMPLLRQSWFFQEHMLSPRMLYFTNWEILWQCRERSTCICEVRNYRDVAQKPHLKKRFEEQLVLNRSTSLQLLWCDIVTWYSERQLTFDSDKLAALAAVAKLLSNTALGRYASGLWESRIDAGLLWNVKGPLVGFDGEPIDSRRSTDLSMPSWSWASIIGPVSLDIGTGLAKDFEVVDILYGPDSGKSLLEASATAIIIHGLLCECKVWDSGAVNGRRSDRYNYRLIRGPGMEKDYEFQADVASEVSCGRNEAMTAYVLNITGERGVVLRKLDTEEGTYRRIGDIGYQVGMPVTRLTYTHAVLKLV